MSGNSKSASVVNWRLGLPVQTGRLVTLREPEARYGLNVIHADTILSYVLPNYFDFGLNMPVKTNPDKDYFYLGVPALLALPFLIRRRRFRELLPSLAVLAASLVGLGHVLYDSGDPGTVSLCAVELTDCRSASA